jgi:uncharacterized protein (TIGR00369 family)
MKKIYNPFVIHHGQGYNCFGCSPNNDFGLHLEFWDTGNGLVTKWDPKNWLVGYGNILHGGIQATLMDEIAGWVVLVKCKTAGVTVEMNIKYLKPVSIGKGVVEVKSKLEKMEGNIADISCELFDGEGVCCATADLKYFCYPEPIARRKLGYPGIEAFYQSSGD